ncbi:MULTISPECIES: energy transducer TonB [unclassified Lentimonas]|uniref:energy transducer TonB n=1 Tax=unclassified Lentimonas TaxID=2630993 RepID=UPI00132C30EA|nr:MULTISPECIES: energy transducer TonB [unclassified Lentimonas]CAA6695439.1 Unannotated [Lentimonas sp. CC10]CAA6696612.1 Unannotated [Lentimonas sp. CC19]CAA7071308.1 Unannotated [Lentimonas sp. CC11]
MQTSHDFPKQQFKWARPLSFAGACILTAGLFWIIPLTQLLDTPTQPDVIVREMTIGKPPRPETPPPPEPTPPKEQPQPNPEIAPKAAPIEIQPLDIDISPGNGDALAMGAPINSALSTNELFEDIEQLFSFEDLAEAPRLINTPSFRFPTSLTRRGVKRGKVIVEIDILPNGSANLLRIITASHPELEATARQIVRSARFTPPKVNGQPQTVRGRFPIVLDN